jgi:hypothetical protein
MFVERLNVVAWADGAQVHRDAVRVYREFFGGLHEFSTETFALLRRIDAQQSQVHAVFTLLEIDAADRIAGFFEQQKLAGAEIFQIAVAVDAVAANEGALDFKRGVDKLRE